MYRPRTLYIQWKSILKLIHSVEKSARKSKFSTIFLSPFHRNQEKHNYLHMFISFILSRKFSFCMVSKIFLCMSKSISPIKKIIVHFISSDIQFAVNIYSTDKKNIDEYSCRLRKKKRKKDTFLKLPKIQFAGTPLGGYSFKNRILN